MAGEINVHTSCTIDRDIPIGTEWRMKTSGTERFFDTYQTTSDPIQFHLISNCRTDLQFINNTTSRVFLFSVDWLSQKEYQEGYVDPGTPSNFVRTMLPNS
jgi:hypothetical protein